VTDRRRNAIILGIVAVLLAGALLVIIPGSPASKPTRLGLDLKGGVELVYQARPTPKVPEVTPEAIDDSIATIRKRTDALGVSEPEIQRAGENEISIGLPDVSNAARAEEQVGTTAQLQFYDWEPNVYGNPNQPFNDFAEAVTVTQDTKPRAEDTDIPPGGASDEIEQRFGDNKQAIRQHYDRQNDSIADKYYVFDAKNVLIRPGGVGAEEGDLSDRNDATAFYGSCSEIAEDFSGTAARPRQPTQARVDEKAKPAKDTACPETMDKLVGQPGAPGNGSKVVKVPRGIVIVKAEPPEEATENTPAQYYVIEDDSELSGSEIENPEQNFDQRTQEPIVTMEFTDAGKKAFARVTKRIAERGAFPSDPAVLQLPPEQRLQRFMIALDGQIVSLATIDYRQNPDGIDGETGAQINGIGNIEDTQDLANNLRIGALPVSLKLISKTQVSATLGKQALDQGLIAAGVGLALTLLFLIAFYRVLGVLAGLALLVYAILSFALVKLIPITLTLPGVAGLVLTLGVAADANIVIFERIKEEARAGRTIPAAIANGYTKALRTIIDANVVTIGVAFILFMLATSTVKGFAFTLGIGTLVSLFTAVLATSAILGSLARTRFLGSRYAIGIGKRSRDWRIDFTGLSKYFFSMSGLILLAGALAIAAYGVNFGIDFESGTRITTPLERSASTDQVRSALEPLGYEDAKIQEVEDPELGDNVVQISTQQLEPERVTEVQRTLDEEFGTVNFSSTSVGPTFGQQIARTAVIAIIASLILISIYIGLRFEFKFAVPVLIAVAHDLLITAGVYALFQREVNTATVAALLTILGYSLYDTIIVFDRIRENIPRMPRATFSQIVNRAMSEVLTRSIVTSSSTIMPIVALMLFGGETLQDFGFALLVGVVSGTYSSVFIASPVLTHWKEREPAYRRRRKVLMDEHGGEVPPFADIAAPGEDVEPEYKPSRVERAAATRRQRRRAKAAEQRARQTARPERAEPDEPAAGDEPVPERGAEEIVAPVATEEPAEQPTAAGEPEPDEDPTGVRARAAARAAARRSRPAAAKPDGGDGDGDGAGGSDSEPEPSKPANKRRKRHGRR
jgi:SecD/SecF fusion protein